MFPVQNGGGTPPSIAFDFHAPWLWPAAKLYIDVPFTAQGVRAPCEVCKVTGPAKVLVDWPGHSPTGGGTSTGGGGGITPPPIGGGGGLGSVAPPAICTVSPILDRVTFFAPGLSTGVEIEYRSSAPTKCAVGAAGLSLRNLTTTRSASARLVSTTSNAATGGGTRRGAFTSISGWRRGDRIEATATFTTKPVSPLCSQCLLAPSTATRTSAL